MARLLRALVVEDSADDAALVSSVLRRSGFSVSTQRVDTSAALRAALRGAPWDIVLCDHSLPQLDAPAALKIVREFDDDVPFLVVSSVISDLQAVALMHAGAADYLRKDNLHRLGAAVDQALRHVDERRARRAAEAELVRMAWYDEGTGLPNRQHLRRTLDGLLAAEEAVETVLAVIELRQLDAVAETFGYEHRDAVVKTAACRLQEAFSDCNMLARLSEDRLALAFSLREGQAMEDLASQLRHLTRARIHIGAPVASLGVSAALARSSVVAGTAGDLLRAGELALQAARREVDSVAGYCPVLEAEATDRFSLLRDLEAALERGALSLAYEPKLEVASGGIRGFEALLRWPHPTRGYVPPAVAVTLAEQAGLIHSLTLWVLDNALRQLRSWRQCGIRVPLAINLSAYDLAWPSFPQEVRLALREHGLGPEDLELEVTESALGENGAALTGARRLAEMGVRLSLDDFGTGYSALSRLRELPIGELKVDRSFLSAASSSSADEAVLRMILNLAVSLGLSVVAEGVECEAQLELLRGTGLPLLAQGFYYTEPLPAAAVEDWLRDRSLCGSELSP